MLPRSTLRRIADYRFGYAQDGRRFDFREQQGPRGPVATIDGRIQIQSTAEFLPDLRFHFVDNGQSRDEIGAFTDAASTLPPDPLLYDVGAHRGLFSLVHCALGPARRAVLFEPSISLSKDARALLALNGFDSRTEGRARGVGERSGTRLMAEDALGFAGLADDQDADAVPIEFTTLDAECRRTGEVPAVVKIDVEGAEAEVIRGSAALLRDARPLVFLELHLDVLERRAESVDALLSHLTSYGYRFREPGGRARSARAIRDSLRAIVRIVAFQ
ncbi:MAG TPA: FkbM family methyltransferase [Vicinamibacterales bacterium]|nr:FkbM family methyltransferase [Vicinamibacterales bacterium]